MLLNVKFPGRGQLIISCQKADEVKTVIQNVAKELHSLWQINSDEIRLKLSFSGDYLDNNMRLQFYDLESGDTVFGFFLNEPSEPGVKQNPNMQSNSLYESINQESGSYTLEKNSEETQNSTPNFNKEASKIPDSGIGKVNPNPSMKVASEVGSQIPPKKMKQVAITLDTIEENDFTDWTDNKNDRNQNPDVDEVMSFVQNKMPKPSPKTPKKQTKAKVSFVIGEPSSLPDDYSNVGGGAITDIRHASYQPAAVPTQEPGIYPIFEQSYQTNAQGPYSLRGQQSTQTNEVPNTSVLAALAEEIVEMGFEYDLVVRALIQSNYDKEAALNRILNNFVESTGGDYSGVSHDTRNVNDQTIYSDPVIGPQLPYNYPPSGQPIIEETTGISVKKSVIPEIKTNENRFVAMLPFEITQNQIEIIEPLLKDNEFQDFKHNLKIGNNFSFPNFLEFLGKRFASIYEVFIINPELMKIALTETFSAIENNINYQEETLSEVDRSNIESVDL
jgi:hypothetical protein